MSFTLADLIVENSIRLTLETFRSAAQQADALTNMDSTAMQLVNNLFNFTATGNIVRSVGPDGTPLPNLELEGGLGARVAGKYSQERTRLITFFRDNEVAVVHSFNDVQVHLPCVSIQLAADGEDVGLALTDDFGGIDGLTITTNENAPGGGYAMGRDINTIHANATINVGIHTKEQLVTKYLYHVVKYAILSNKEELIRQNFIIATFKGSDFSRDAGWQGDHVYTRFLNISGKTEDSWVNIDEIVADVQQIDVQVYVAQDTAPFSAPASQVDASIPDNATQIQVANSFYLGTGLATIVHSLNGVVQPSTNINITANDAATNIITVDLLTTGITVGGGNSVYVVRGQGTETINQSFTIQTLPGNVQMGEDKTTVNDEATVIHRTTVRQTVPTT